MMQVSATLIAAQQAAREARQRLAMPQNPAQAAPQVHQAKFAAALEQTPAAGAGFSALPLRQMAPQQAPASAPQPAAPAQMGQHVDITV
jgi:hypothetical protein